MRIGIIGAGALGTLFGYRLAHENDVSMLEIRPEVIAAIRAQGLGIAEHAARRNVTISASARDLFASQVLFIFVRATDTMRASGETLCNSAMCSGGMPRTTILRVSAKANGTQANIHKAMQFFTKDPPIGIGAL